MPDKFVTNFSINGEIIKVKDEAAANQLATIVEQISNIGSGVTDLPYVKRSGDTMTGDLNMDTHSVTGLPATPTGNYDATSKAYVDSRISDLGTLFRLKDTVATEADLPTTNNSPGDLYLVTENQGEYVWVVNTAHPEGQWESLGPLVDLTPYLLKSGGTMTGDLDMGGHNIRGMATPTSDSDAATKKYVDDTIQGGMYVLNKATGTFLGGVKANAATADDTQDINIDGDGFLKTLPRMKATYDEANTRITLAY